MGLLSSEAGDSDFEQAFQVAASIQEFWNTKQAPSWGFNLTIFKASIRECCEAGGRLFSGQYFANPPGPFKRAAAFLVIGRLMPFFGFEPINGNKELVPQTSRECHAWLARMMALSIPAVLGSTRAQLGGEWLTLSEWGGFPSSHFKLEFLAWIRWLDSFEHFKKYFPSNSEWDQLHEQRLARMVMATSLMIEGCYYCSGSTASESKIRGNTATCFERLEDEHEIDLIYDVHTVYQSPEFPPGAD